MTLQEAIEKGLRDDAGKITTDMIATEAPLDIINEELIPALNHVGDGFEKGTVFLPQLLMSAEAAKSAPTVSGAKKKTDTSYTGTYSYYRLSFTGLNASDLTTYLAKVNQVKVNDTVLTRGYSSSSLADINFRPAATDTTYSTSAYDVLDLPLACLPMSGDYNIKLTDRWLR